MLLRIVFAFLSAPPPPLKAIPGVCDCDPALCTGSSTGPCINLQNNVCFPAVGGRCPGGTTRCTPPPTPTPTPLPPTPLPSPAPPTPMPAQINLPRVDALPGDGGTGWRFANFNAKASTLYEWLYRERPNGTVFSIDGVRGRWFNGTVPVSLPSYLGRVAECGGSPQVQAPGEALAVVGAVYGAAVSGNWPADLDANYIKVYAGADGVVWNNPPGEFGASYVPTFWYALMNHFLLFGALHALPDSSYNGVGVEDQNAVLLAACAASWVRAAKAVDNNWAHTGFDWRSMSAYDNGLWTEGDAAGGVAWLGIIAHESAARQVAAAVGDTRASVNSDSVSEALQMAQGALEFLESLPSSRSPLYECVLPMGALAAARMNAQHGSNFNVTRLLEWSLSDGSNTDRQGWGMLGGDAQWGDSNGSARYSAAGLIGSLTDGGGYAFAGNSFWFAAMLAPLPRYTPQYARAIGRWLRNLLGASRLFLPDAPEIAARQSNPSPDRWDEHDAVAYEGLRKCDFNRTTQACEHGETFGPFATGDWCELLNCSDVGWTCDPLSGDAGPCRAGSDRALYGGSALGALAAVASATNDTRILRLDTLATDAYRPAAHPTFVYYNPLDEPVWVEIVHKGVEGDGKAMRGLRCDLYDGGNGRLLAAGAFCRSDEEVVAGQSNVANASNAVAALEIPADTAVVVVVVPAGSSAVWHGRTLAVQNRTVCFGDVNSVGTHNNYGSNNNK